MQSYCKRFKALATTNPKSEPQNLWVARLRCKMWDCRYCARKNQAIWRAHIIDRINALGGNWIFVTITAHGNSHRVGKTLENLKRGWKILYDRLRRHFKGQKLEYVMLYEKHKKIQKSGVMVSRYHIHAIVQATVEGSNIRHKKRGNFYHQATTRWLKDNCAAVGLGFMAEAAKIEGANAGLVAAYICKYMTKSCQEFAEFPKRMRRIVTSRGFGSPKSQKSENEWKLRAGIFPPDVIEHDKVIDISTGELVTIRYFKFHEVYPDEYDSGFEDVD